MSSKIKVHLPENLKASDMFTLCDSSWSILFPTYWPSYRRTGSKRNVAKFKVVSYADNNIIIEMMEVAPEEGRITIPVGMQSTTTSEMVFAAMIVSNKLIQA